jgi:hypothetical protein
MAVWQPVWMRYAVKIRVLQMLTFENNVNIINIQWNLRLRTLLIEDAIGKIPFE